MTNVIELGKDFFFGGNSTFTIQSEKTNDWRTYKIRQMEVTERFPNPAFTVSLLAGPCNETNYVYIGLIDPNTGSIRFTKASKRNDSSPDVVILRWFMNHLFTDKVLPNAVVRHAGKCGCCGRKLTTPQSLIRGIGPECWSRICGA
jgi:hypothetical protein